MAGSESTQFRSALHGFNRYDVVRYIEKASGEHEHALREAQKESAALSEQVRALEEERAAREAELEALRTAQDAHNAEKDKLQSLLDAAEEESASLREQLASASAQEPELPEEPSAPSSDALELAAYRRAEAVERGAVERAGALYDRMSGVCQSLSDRVQASASEVSLLYTELSDSLERMKEALADLKLVLENAPEEIASLHDEVSRDD